MDQELLKKVMNQVKAELGAAATPAATVAPAASAPAAAPSMKGDATGISKALGRTEFVGTSIGDTIGLVIASVDPMLKDAMKLGKFRSIGIIGGRTGAGPQIMAVDDAVKATNTEIISVELPRDTKGGAGHGSLILIGAKMYLTPAGLSKRRCRSCRNISAMSTAMMPAIWNFSILPAPAIAWKRHWVRNSAKPSA